MQVFVYEYVSSQHGELPASLRREGAAMLAAILDDAVKLPGAVISTLVADADLPVPAAVVRHWLAPGADERAAFQKLSRAADVTFVVAPEIGGLLRERHDWAAGLGEPGALAPGGKRSLTPPRADAPGSPTSASILPEQSGSTWAGCSAASIDLATDKLALARRLQEAGVPTPTCVSFEAGVARALFPLVFKPRDGAGSQATFLARDAAELAARLADVHAEGWHGPAIVQRFAPGQAVSVAVLVGPGQIVPLLPAAQLLSDDGRFRYLGGRIPLPADLSERARRLALRAVAAVPGLLGYVGVDLVLGAATDGRLDQVIEINPRLTTSYVGLRALARANLFAALLAACRGEPPILSWQPGAVNFDAAGNVHLSQR